MTGALEDTEEGRRVAASLRRIGKPDLRVVVTDRRGTAATPEHIEIGRAIALEWDEQSLDTLIRELVASRRLPPPEAKKRY